ncbi:hypothetical protein ACI2KH_20040 [Roseomonas mucosa]|uniref:hypothetical protein n=1 Tax=Roseomonas mucosa TaxID=207340 RepID=UPI0038504952
MRQFRPATVRVPERADPVIRRLFGLMNEERLGWADLAERSGVSERTIRAWRTAYAPSLPSIQAVLGVFGYELVVRKTKAREDEDRLYARAGFISEARMDALLEEAAISTRLAAQTGLSGPENGSEGHVGGGAR